MNPGSTEAIFQTPMYDWWMGSGWSLGPQFVCSTMAGETNTVVFSPTANYVNYYGMANGLPLNDPDSGFDKEYPWKDRDPRFIMTSFTTDCRSFRIPVALALRKEMVRFSMLICTQVVIIGMFQVKVVPVTCFANSLLLRLIITTRDFVTMVMH